MNSSLKRNGLIPADTRSKEQGIVNYGIVQSNTVMYEVPGLTALFIMADNPVWQTSLGFFLSSSFYFFVSSYSYFILNNKSPHSAVKSKGWVLGQCSSQWASVPTGPGDVGSGGLEPDYHTPGASPGRARHQLCQRRQRSHFFQASPPPSKSRTAKAHQANTT